MTAIAQVVAKLRINSDATDGRRLVGCAMSDVPRGARLILKRTAQRDRNGEPIYELIATQRHPRRKKLKQRTREFVSSGSKVRARRRNNRRRGKFTN